ncbi:MAG TPA: PhoH family protein [bacterium]|nr:PhoH family protein [bacterium]HPQ18954.1 PhoH family protein [bacterium]
MSKKKIFILDTNVLLYDAQALFQFGDNDVILPMIVIEELDRFKRRPDEIGQNSRLASRFLDELRAKGKLNEGVELPGGGKLKIELENKNKSDLPTGLDASISDNKILTLAYNLMKETENEVILVTKDINLRVKADVLNIKAEDYKKDKVDIKTLYPGVRELEIEEEVIKSLREYSFIKFEEFKKYSKEEFYPNECIILQNRKNKEDNVYCYYNRKRNMLIKNNYTKGKIWGIKPRNKEQYFAFELLLNDEINLVTLLGFAGTGKTLLALAAGLKKVVDDGVYTKLLVSRPIIPMGRDIGYLPGDIEEKLRPRMQPIADNLEFLFKESGYFKSSGNEFQDLIDEGVLEIEALTFIRGRSIPNQFIIIDEAQNLTPHEVKTIITRVGNNTKIIFTGDPYQIDHPYLDSNSNGLTYLVEKFKDQEIAGHITFNKGERSELAEIAAKIL